MDSLYSLKSVLSKFEEPMLIFDEQGMVFFSSDQANKLLSMDDLEGKLLHELILEPRNEFRYYISNPNSRHFKEMTVCFVSEPHMKIKLNIFVWSRNTTKAVFCATLYDHTFIHRRRRDILRKALTIEALAKSKTIRNGNLNEAVYEILKLSSRANKVGRVNAWLFDELKNSILCLGNFDRRVEKMVEQGSLPRSKYPEYFNLFETKKIILVPDALHSETTEELKEEYLIPKNIGALMDIPIRSSGEIIGVICFENIGKSRDWSIEDQKFGLIAAQMVSLALETHEKNLAEKKLQNELDKKRALLKETNHRIKNNLAILSSLLKLQQHKSKDEFHAQLFEDSRNRLNSIVELHDLLNKSQSFESVNILTYMESIVEQLNNQFNKSDAIIFLESESFYIQVSKAVSIGLIVNEILTNAYKYAADYGEILLKISRIEGAIVILISDRGKGFDYSEVTNTLGLEIVQDLTSQLDGTLNYENNNGSIFKINIPM